MKKQTSWTLEMLLLLFGLIFLVSSCSNLGSDGEWGSGPVLREVREVAQFHSIEILGNCQVIFRKDVQQELVVEAEANILPLIKTWVRNDGTLIIENEKDFHSNKGVTVYASMCEIRRFAIFGAAEIKGEHPFSCNDLNLSIEGAGKMQMHVDANNVISSIVGGGDISLAGRAGSHNFEIIGAGILEALDFSTSSCKIYIAGAGTCRIHVMDALYVVLDGAGVVFYKGNPAVIDSQITGVGALIKL